jgi:hypothetical protein
MKKIIYTICLLAGIQLTVSAQDHTTAPKVESNKKQTEKKELKEGETKNEVSAPSAAPSVTTETAAPKRKTRMAINEKGVPKK